MKKKVKSDNRYCPICGHKLQKYELTKDGSQKWHCLHYHSYLKISKKYKKKQKVKLWLFKYFEYLLHIQRKRLSMDVTDRHLEKIKIFKNENIFIPESGNRHLVIYLDGLRVNKKACLIASNGKHVIGFCLVDYESSSNWRNFLKNFNEPEYVVCDGQNGLIKAIKSVWFNVKIQRYLFHVWTNIKQKLTLNPETQAGQELLCLSREL